MQKDTSSEIQTVTQKLTLRDGTAKLVTRSVEHGEATDGIKVYVKGIVDELRETEAAIENAVESITTDSANQIEATLADMPRRFAAKVTARVGGLSVDQDAFRQSNAELKRELLESYTGS